MVYEIFRTKGRCPPEDLDENFHDVRFLFTLRPEARPKPAMHNACSVHQLSARRRGARPKAVLNTPWCAAVARTEALFAPAGWVALPLWWTATVRKMAWC